MKYVHSPVLLNSVLDNLITGNDRLFLDCTLGEGGHTEAILNKFSSINVYGLDRDAKIIEVAKERLSVFGERFKGVNINFTRADSLESEGILFDAALIDLGISVYHYKRSGRGFTFSNNEPLDMTLDNDGIPVSHIVNEYSESELKEILYKYAEERFAPHIAGRIVKYRLNKRIETSLELAEIIEGAIPHKFRSRNIHPATKAFQAFRIAANGELENIEKGIPAVLSMLKSGGRLGVITFHSIEDRIVKKIFAELNKECICPPKMPVCRCGKVREVKLIGKSITPDPEELDRNPPSRSARLRIVEKI